MCLSYISSAQSASDSSNTIRGIVLNSVTHEPIARALVTSESNHFAALTNSDGRFEFTLPDAHSATEDTSISPHPANGRIPPASTRPISLMARKPGFLSDPNNAGQTFRNSPSNGPSTSPSKDVILTLIPEALIIGAVTLSTAEAPESVTLQLYRHVVQDGRAHWSPAGTTRSTSDGQFRFSDLSAGTYKLLSNELLDRDPVTFDPREEARGPLFGYPPVYYQSAPDFEAASAIQLSPGQTQTVNLALVKQPYYRVKLPVVVPASEQSEFELGVTVYAHGHKGPGFSLGYNPLHHAVEGMLPNGTYTVEVTSVRPNGASGLQTITIKGAPIDGPTMALLPNSSIRINVREEFTASDHSGDPANGPRRYLDISMEPADDVGVGRSVPLSNPAGPGDESLLLEGAGAGIYWVRVHSSRGYPASIRSGNLDLQHQPLVVGAGGGAPPIEITMRDDTAEISGTVDMPQTHGPGSLGVGAAQGRAHVYCIPMPDSPGQFTQIWVHPDGTFDAPGLAPGSYRLLAFDGMQNDLEYRNPEAMRSYESKGPVVRVVAGQKEHVQLQLIPANASGNEE